MRLFHQLNPAPRTSHARLPTPSGARPKARNRAQSWLAISAFAISCLATSACDIFPPVDDHTCDESQALSFLDFAYRSDSIEGTWKPEDLKKSGLGPKGFSFDEDGFLHLSKFGCEELLYPLVPDDYNVFPIGVAYVYQAHLVDYTIRPGYIRLDYFWKAQEGDEDKSTEGHVEFTRVGKHRLHFKAALPTFADDSYYVRVPEDSKDSETSDKSPVNIHQRD